MGGEEGGEKGEKWGEGKMGGRVGVYLFDNEESRDFIFFKEKLSHFFSDFFGVEGGFCDEDRVFSGLHAKSFGCWGERERGGGGELIKMEDVSELKSRTTKTTQIELRHTGFKPNQTKPNQTKPNQIKHDPKLLNYNPPTTTNHS